MAIERAVLSFHAMIAITTIVMLGPVAKNQGAHYESTSKKK